MDIGHSILQAGLLLGVLMVMVATFQFVVTLIRLGLQVVAKTILGYYLIVLWAFFSIVSASLLHPSQRLWATISLTAIFLLSTQFVIIANRPQESIYDRPTEFMLTLGWLGLGMLLAQAVTSKAIVVSLLEINGFVYSTLHPILLYIVAVRGLFIFVLLGRTASKMAFDERIQNSRPFIVFGGVSGVFAFAAIFLHILLARVITSVDLNSLIFTVLRIMVILAVVSVFFGIMFDMRYIMAGLRGVTGDFLRDKVNFAVYTFNERGPEILFSYGFSTDHQDEDEAFINLLSIGMAGLALLGRGEEYVEGSAILPIAKDKVLDALVINKWVSDSSQQSVRMKKRTYLSFIIGVEPRYLWLIENRSVWENRFETLLQPVEDIQDLTPEMFHQFISDMMVDISINRI